MTVIVFMLMAALRLTTANLSAAFLNQLLSNNQRRKSNVLQLHTQIFFSFLCSCRLACLPRVSSLHMKLKRCPVAPSVSLIRRDLVPLWDEQPQPADGGGPGDDLSRRVDTGAAALLPPHRPGGVVPLQLLRSVASSLCLCSPSQVKYLAGHGGLLFAALRPREDVSRPEFLMSLRLHI